jgi:hypothetical protein
MRSISVLPVLLTIIFTVSCIKAEAQSLESIKLPNKCRSMRATSGNPVNNSDAWHFKPGETRELARLKGPGEIRHMWFTAFSENIRYPRAFVLRIYWDGSDVPSVETPMGDFFAAGNGMAAEINSVPVNVKSFGRGYNCYWVMPFAREARITLTNESAEFEAGSHFMIDWVQYDQIPEPGILYFHARYHQDYEPVYGEYYTVFETKGKGQYVGTVLSSQNRTGHWYGEGDDFWYIDGEKKPGMYGTGTEDYFNEAWNMRVHSGLYTGCTIFEPRAIDARVTAYRWHIPDPVYFKKSVRFQLERTGFILDSVGNVITSHGHRPDYWSSVSYWYQDDIARPWCSFPSYNQRVNPEIVIQLPKAIDRIRHSAGVELRVNPYNRATYTKPWFQAVNNTVGEWIEIPFEIKEKGLYSMSLFQHLREDSGIWKILIDNKELYDAGESQIAGGYEVDKVRQMSPEEINTTLDFCNIFRKNEHEDYIYGQRRERKIGLFEFEPGIHTVKLICVGSNPLTAEHGSGRLRYNLTADIISFRKFPDKGLKEWVNKVMRDAKDEQ